MANIEELKQIFAHSNPDPLEDKRVRRARQITTATLKWYYNNKDSKEFKDKKSKYMRDYRAQRKKQGAAIQNPNSNRHYYKHKDDPDFKLRRAEYMKNRRQRVPIALVKWDLLSPNSIRKVLKNRSEDELKQVPKHISDKYLGEQNEPNK